MNSPRQLLADALDALQSGDTQRVEQLIRQVIAGLPITVDRSFGWSSPDRPKDRLFVTIQMPCGCMVGSHPPDRCCKLGFIQGTNE